MSSQTRTAHEQVASAGPFHLPHRLGIKFPPNARGRERVYRLEAERLLQVTTGWLHPFARPRRGRIARGKA
jgi:hypothetical protein